MLASDILSRDSLGLYSKRQKKKKHNKDFWNMAFSMKYGDSENH